MDYSGVAEGGNNDVSLWIELTSDYGSDSIILTWKNYTYYGVYGAVWTGSAWDDIVLHDAAGVAATTVKQTSDSAWEGTSGDGFTIWGISTTTDYSVYSGGTWTNGSGSVNPGAAVVWLQAAGSPNNDYIGLITVDTVSTSSADVNVDMWNGSDWTTVATPTEDADINNNGYAQAVDVAWEVGSSSDRVLFAWRDGVRATVASDTTVSYMVYDISANQFQAISDGGTECTLTEGGAGTIEVVTGLDLAEDNAGPCLSTAFLKGNTSGVILRPDPSSTKIMLIAENETTLDMAPEMKLWDGVANGTWTQSATMGAFETDLSTGVLPTAALPTKPYDFAFNKAGTVFHVAGECLDYDQSAACPDSQTVKVAYNANLQAQTGLTKDGTFTVPGLTAPSSGDVITIFIDGVADANEASAISKYDNSGNSYGYKLMEEHVTLGSNDYQTITNANISNYDYSASTNDEDIIFEYDGGTSTLTIDSPAGNSTQEELYILTGNTYQPDASDGETLITHDLENNGTITANANTFKLAGSWDNNSVFTAGTSSVIMTATSGSETINSTGATVASFYDLTGGEGSGTATWTFNPSLDVDNNLTVAYGELSAINSDVTLGNDLSLGASGSYTTTAGVFTFDGTGTNNWTDSNSTKSNMGTVDIYGSSETVALGSSIKATKVRVRTGQTLDLGSSGYALRVTGSGTAASMPFLVEGSLTEGSDSLVAYTGTAATEIENETYHDLELAPSGVGSPTFTLGSDVSQTINVSGNLTMGGDTYDVSVDGTTYDPTLNVDGNVSILATGTLLASNSSTFTVGGNWSNAGILTHNSGTITFDAGDAANTIDAGGTDTDHAFYKVIFNNGSGGWTIQTSDMKTASDLTITDVSDFYIDTGRTLQVGGAYAIEDAETGATDLADGTLYLNSGTAYTVGSKNNDPETYGTLQIGANTDIRSWNSTASTFTVDATGSLYSQDHANTNGDVYIYGDYNVATTDNWSYATDFDGTDLSGGSERQVDVRVDSAGSVKVGSGEEIMATGTSDHRTTVDNISGTDGYGMFAYGGSAIEFSYTDFDHMDGPRGLYIEQGVSVMNMDYCSFDNLDSTAATDNSLIYLKNAIGSDEKTWTGVIFDNTNSEADFNVNLEDHADVGYWDFNSSSGSFDGEAYDGFEGVNEANPGYIRWDDSAWPLTGKVWLADNETDATDANGGPCDGATAVLSLRVDGGAETTTSCSDTDATFTFDAVTATAGQTIAIYLNSNSTDKANRVYVSDGTIDSDMRMIIDRVIIGDENDGTVNITDLDAYDDTTNATDMLFDAVDDTTDTITVNSDKKLNVWQGDIFDPNGTVTTTGSTSGDLVLDQDSTAYIDEGSSAIGNDIAIIGGGTNTTLSIGENLSVAGGTIGTVGTNCTVTYTGTPTVTVSGTGNIGGGTSPSITFYILNLSGVPTLASNIVIAKNLDMTSDLVAGTYNVIMTSTNGNIYGGGGTLYNLVINPSSPGTIYGREDLTVSNVLTVEANDHFYINNGVIIDAPGTLTLNGTIEHETTGILRFTDTSSGPGATGTLSSYVYYDATDGDIADTTFDARLYGDQVRFFSSSSTARSVTFASGTYDFGGAFYIDDDGAAPGDLAVTGAANNPVVNITGNLDFVGTGSASEIIVSGNNVWTVEGDVNFSNGTYTATTGNTFIMYNGLSASLNTNSQTFYNFQLAAGGVSCYDPFIVSNDFTVSDQSFYAYDSVNVDGVFHVETDGLFAAMGAYNTNIGGDITIDGIYNYANSTATIFDGNLTYLDNHGATNMGYLQIGGSSDTVDLGTDITAKSLTVNSTNALYTNGFDIDVDIGGISVSGTLDATDDVETNETQINNAGDLTINSGATFNADQSTIIMDGRDEDNDQIITDGSFSLYNLTIYHYLTVEVEDALDVNGTLNISSGTLDTLAGESNSINVAGNWITGDKFVANSSLVTLDGDSQQTVSGTLTGINAFYDLTVTNSFGTNPQTDPSVIFSDSTAVTRNFTDITPNSKLRFLAAGDFTFQNINLNGQDIDSLVSLRSSSAGSVWNLNVAGTRSVYYTDAKDSYACAVAPDIDATHISNLDSTGNDCWNFAFLSFDISDTTIGFGSLTAANARYATGTSGSDSKTPAHTLTVYTSAENGYNVTYYGDTLTSSAGSISAATITGDDNGDFGQSQFALGITTAGDATIASGYDAATPADYKFEVNNLTTLFSEAAATDSEEISAYYISNIEDTTPAGEYTTSITYIMTASF